MRSNKIQQILTGTWLAFALTASLSAQAPQRPHITGVAHISLLAHDFEKSRAFYSQFLGFQEPYTLKNPDGSTSMTFFKINDRQYIELAPEHVSGTDRLSHISLETDDIEALLKEMRDRAASGALSISDTLSPEVYSVMYEEFGAPVRA